LNSNLPSKRTLLLPEIANLLIKAHAIAIFSVGKTGVAISGIKKIKRFRKGCPKIGPSFTKNSSR